MAQWHGISRRKSTGGRRVAARGKRSTEISSEKQFALIGEPRRKIYRTTGGNTLVRVLSENKCTVNGKDGKSSVATITSPIFSVFYEYCHATYHYLICLWLL